MVLSTHFRQKFNTVPPCQKLKTHRIWSTIFWEGPQIHIKKNNAWEGQCQD